MKRESSKKKGKTFAALLALIMFVGLTAGAPAPALATDSDANYRCAFAFCYAVTDYGGGRTIWLKITPVNNVCYDVNYWITGQPHRLTPPTKPWMVSQGWFYYQMPAYSPFFDATIQAYNCQTGAKIFTRLVRAGGPQNPDAWI